MNRHWKNISIDPQKFNQIAGFLCSEFSTSTYLPQTVNSGWSKSNLIALGTHKSTNDFEGNFFDQIDKLVNSSNDWAFGHFGYNLQRETDGCATRLPNEDGFPDGFFFVPQVLIFLDGRRLQVGGTTMELTDHAINLIKSFESIGPDLSDIVLGPRTTRDMYLEKCNQLLRHIHRGDIYEINYCIDFIGNSTNLLPTQIFARLQELSEAPFAALYKHDLSWLMCASPERFLCKQGTRLFSQPIKGTRKRSSNASEDGMLYNQLAQDPKEKMENVMIVDLVRNDLSRIAKKGSVQVPELFQIHTFKTVHQMISTVECEIETDKPLSEIIKATFPMGSMTGAPKISAMKLADLFEDQARGIYSGAVGFITPDRDFDFNVVIRSITWNEVTGHISAKTGSALTASAIPEKEYEECLVKVAAMMNALKRV